jgi:hypothetical protein
VLRPFTILGFMLIWALEPQSASPGKDIASSLKVEFKVPAPWTSQQIVMDPIWQPLRLSGVNYYAFGAPVEGHPFASRSDPRSPLYQAWIGTYVVAGGRDRFSTGDFQKDFSQAIQLAEFDQRAWLEGMGDPAPQAKFKPPYTIGHIRIEGVDRTLYSFDMDSHSDIGEGTSEIAKEFGMPPKSEWSACVSAFHPLTLHVLYAFWHDPHKDMTFVVYGASSSFRDKSGVVHDNGPGLHQQLLQIISSMHTTALSH